MAGPSGGGSATQPIHVEVSSPAVTGAPTRGPDANGWYNHPVTIAFSGSSFSGIASCTTATYGGPANGSARVNGSCTDNAGKTVQAISAPFAYDAVPPSLNMTADTGDEVTLVDWTMTDVVRCTGFELVRQPGLHGNKPSVVYRGLATSFKDKHVRNGVRYQYVLLAADEAGNSATHAIVVRPGRRLLSPGPGAQLTAPPLLRWTAVRRARYYNVQLYRGNRKVLSTWPRQSSLQLASTWRFGGHRHRLRPGRYRWYVWPGYGSLTSARYGRVIGTSTFVVT